jgi:hypothetical protein
VEEEALEISIADDHSDEDMVAGCFDGKMDE